MYLWEQITHYQCDGENRVIFSRILDHQLRWHMFIIKRLLTNQCHPQRTETEVLHQTMDERYVSRGFFVLPGAREL